MMPLTVKQLLDYLEKEHKKGHDDYVVFVTDDEEANGYHGLWFIGQCAKEMTPSNRKYSEQSNCDLCVLKDKDKAIYLG